VWRERFILFGWGNKVGAVAEMPQRSVHSKSEWTLLLYAFYFRKTGESLILDKFGHTVQYLQ
jgi:hypothetical protein